jgi:hypothetical protein
VPVFYRQREIFSFPQTTKLRDTTSCWLSLKAYLVCFEEVLLRVKEQRNILHEIRKWKANYIGHILCRNCLPQRVIEGKIKGGIEVTGR